MQDLPSKPGAITPSRNALGQTLQQAAARDHLWREKRHRHLLRLWRKREAAIVHLCPILLTAAAIAVPGVAISGRWFHNEHGMAFYYTVLFALLVGIGCSSWRAYLWHRRDAQRALREEW
jgi:hypothetical protein